jgi:hypothetical protein
MLSRLFVVASITPIAPHRNPRRRAWRRRRSVRVLAQVDGVDEIEGGAVEHLDLPVGGVGHEELVGIWDVEHALGLGQAR